MDEYPMKRLTNEKLTLVVTSTFGSGEAPDNGKVSHYNFNEFSIIDLR